MDTECHRLENPKELSNRSRLSHKKILPRVLIGSSWEGLPVAAALRENLEVAADVIPWKQGFTPLTGAAAGGLVQSLGSIDFAIFLLTAEDVTMMCAERTTVTRDNVLLLLGIAWGVLGRERTFLVHPGSFRKSAPEFHISVDVLGMTPAIYNSQGFRDNPTAALATACSQIRREIARQGMRPPPPALCPSPALQTPVPSPPSAGLPEPVTPELPSPPPPASVVAPVSVPPGRIRLQLNRRIADRRPEAQIEALKGWWDDLSEKQRRSIIRFQEVDKLLNLRSGTTRTYLKEIAEAAGYTADHEASSLVIYHPVAA